MSSRKKWIIGLAPLVVIAWLVVLAAAFGGSTDAKITTPDATPVVAHTPAPPAAPAAPASQPPSETAGQQNARQSAEDYLSTMPFSRSGLIRQLSSSAGDGYTVADVTYAVDAIDVDWNEQAAKSAKNYLSTMPFSRTELIQQLESSAGDGFTAAQAEYGVNAAYTS